MRAASSAQQQGGQYNSTKSMLQGLTRHKSVSAQSTALAMASRVKRLKPVVEHHESLDERPLWEVSERRQVGDAETMVNPGPDIQGAWWRKVGVEEGV